MMVTEFQDSWAAASRAEDLPGLELRLRQLVWEVSAWDKDWYAQRRSVENEKPEKEEAKPKEGWQINIKTKPHVVISRYAH